MIYLSIYTMILFMIRVAGGSNEVDRWLLLDVVKWSSSPQRDGE
jgi:hypothetical protein